MYFSVQTQHTYKYKLLPSYNMVVLFSSFHNYTITYYVCMSFDYTCRLLGCLLLLLLFLTFSVLVVNPKKLLYTMVNPARGLLNREKRTK